MALNTSKCNHLTSLRFKGLGRDQDLQFMTKTDATKTKTKTKTSLNRRRTVSRPRRQSSGLQHCKTYNITRVYFKSSAHTVTQDYDWQWLL